MEETLPGPLNPPDRIEARIYEEIQAALRGVIDPETGLDVVRMGLVKNTRLERAEGGYKAILTFRPNSPVCPMAFKLAWDIQQSARSVRDVESAQIRVEGYTRAAELEAILSEEEKT